MRLHELIEHLEELRDSPIAEKIDCDAHIRLLAPDGKEYNIAFLRPHLFENTVYIAQGSRFDWVSEEEEKEDGASETT